MGQDAAKALNFPRLRAFPSNNAVFPVFYISQLT
jgi:hypothetical protein